MSQSQLSRKSEVSRDLISSAEAGNSHNSDKLHALLNALNDEFFVPKMKTFLDPAKEIIEGE